MSVYSLTGVVRPYAWGSRTLLAELQGRPAPTEQPEAELWLGAHPGDPATINGPDGPVSLEALIADDPKGQLGSQVIDSFGPRLPFLLKVLAAETPLSLQAHPDPEYAKLAYARQEADPSLPRNYTDPHHKPEMLVAVTPFEALCGFRSPTAAADEIESFGLESLTPVVEALRGGDLRTAVQTLLTWPEADRTELIAAVAGSGRSELATYLAGHYPGDPGVLVALLLNHVRLAPGEAIWMPAGNMHAYLKGAGVELMAASDNVLRGGLTPKRVDVGELLNVLRFEVLEDPILPSVSVAPGVTTWKVPVPDFELFRIELDGTGAPIQVPAAGPRIILGISGDTYVGEAVDGMPVELAPGTAAYAPADAGQIKVAGEGQLFVAAVPA
ncbi:mannose-6-phosphate isomerase, class I [Paractinoplanes lichenicola]|uniref:mannose-6-phosphate isomerase n=1 Tax=Paractinoplanes lichenicola TaxID=2802976 RepID=A0ABS1VQ11_9ACTN|nr:mannose-6-phosphate isomerase, class I [Actinoplanes lichenicola]MBL7256809.1 mannose-6-phosphate isomerase, class I [Actinoplanes lichenicola]